MSDSTGNERTPLIQKNTSPNTSYRRTCHIYSAIFGLLFAFSFFVHWYRAILPTPLSDTEAHNLDDFAGLHAYHHYLSHFKAPHSANSRENGRMRDWIVSVLRELQASAEGVELEIMVDNATDVMAHHWFMENEQWVVDSRNVMVRLHGASGSSDALLINAHYDSVPTSHGVTDNGMGVVVTLEMVRYFVAHPPRQTIIFLFNNFEEGGLLGAQSFVRHPWFQSVKLFMNLEGAGAGGRAVLFRCSNLEAVKKFAGSSAHFKHGSPLGNDMFKLQLIKSDTDYSIFTRQGVPGLDIAFYSPRSHYHTPRDDLAHTTPDALQHMGQLALGAVRSIANSDDLSTTSSEQESLIYYDLLGRFMFAYSFGVHQAIQLLVLSVVPITAVALSVLWHRDRAPALLLLLKQRLWTTLHGLISVLAALVSAVVCVAIASVAMTKINPSMTYGDVYGAALYLFSAAFLGIQLSQLVMPSKRVLATTDASWYGLIAFWWLLVVVALYTAYRQMAFLYYAVHVLASNALALLLHVGLPYFKIRSLVVFVTQCILPLTMLLEFEFLCMDSMRHATADGTPEIAVYVLLSIPLIQIALHLIPWIHLAQNQKRVTLSSALAFLLLFSICSALHPFNAHWSPNKLLFRQEYSAGDALATVTLSTGSGLVPLLQQALPPHEYQTLQCEPDRTRCTYQTDLVPLYGRNSTSEFVDRPVTKACDQTRCRATTGFVSQNSLMCRVQFNNKVDRIWVNDREIESQASSVIVYSNAYEQEVRVSVEYGVNEMPPRASMGCFYDEWTRSEIPAFTALRDRLPDYALLLIRGQGLAFVHYANITL